MSELNCAVDLQIVLRVFPMPNDSREEFQITAKCIHPDFVVNPTPTVIGQYKIQGKMALSINVKIMPKSALGAHYESHKYCARCHGSGEVPDLADRLGSSILCRHTPS